MKKFLPFLLLSFVVSREPALSQTVGANQIKRDTTIIKTSLNQIGVDTTNKIPSFYRLYKSIDSLAAISGSSRSVDTLWRVAGIDSIYFKINGIQYAIKDSAGGSSITNYLDSATVLFHVTYGLNGGDVTVGQSISVDTLTNPLKVATQGYVVRQGYGTGTITSIATSSGITGGTITSAGTLKADTALMATNTAVHDSVLAHVADTTSLSNRINLKVNLSDTSSMLNPYLRKLDTLSLSSRINLKVNISDTANMLSPYQRTASATTGTVTSVATGVGLTGGIITTSGTIKSDTTFYTTSSQSGYLRYSDWTTFNNKGSGSVISVATGLGLSGGTITGSGTVLADTSYLQTKSVQQTVTNKLLSTGVVYNGTAISATNYVNDSLSVSHGGTGAATARLARNNLYTNTFVDIYSNLGSSLVSESFGLTLDGITTSGSIGNGVVVYQVLNNTVAGQVVTGLEWYKSTATAYTGANNNQVFLATLSAGTYTIVDSSTNDATMWSTGSANTFQTKNFTQTYTILANTVYVAGIIFCSTSANSPAFGLGTSRVNTAVSAGDFTNSAKITSTISGQTKLTISQAASGATSSASKFWFGLY